MIHRKISNATYHSCPQWGSTTAKLLAPLGNREPLYPVEAKNHRPEVQRGTVQRGTALHTMILEPEIEIKVAPEFRYRTKADKARAIEWLDDQGVVMSPAASANAIREAIGDLPGYVTAEHAEYCRYAREHIDSNTLARDLLEKTRKERSYFVDHRKARPDAWKDGIMIDLKSSSFLDVYGFQRQARMLDYFFSLAWYADILQDLGAQGFTDFVWIVANERGCRVYQVDDDSMSRALDRVEEAKCIISDAESLGEYPDRPAQTEPVTVTDGGNNE